MVALQPIEIRTARLLLRRLASSDARMLLEIHADAGVMRYSNSSPWQGIAEAHDLIDRSSRWLESGQHLCLGIARVDSDGLIGTCTLFDIDRTHQCAEVGFVLGESAWRLGFMTEALVAVLTHAFDGLGLNRIEADTDPQNLAAIKLLERLGFQREGVLRQRWITNGRKSDAALYGLLRDEWRRGAPGPQAVSPPVPEPGRGVLPSSPGQCPAQQSVER